MICLDTYALMEFIQENPLYANLLDQDFVISDATLAEFYSVQKKNHNIATAEYWLKLLTPFSKQVSLVVWIKAISFRQDHSKEKLSIYDCLGYVFAQENKFLFVTGDKAFKNKKGVKFLK